MSPSDATLVASLPLTIRRRDVLHFLEYPDGQEPTARVAALLAAALPVARQLARATGCYRHLPVTEAREIGLRPVDADGLVVGLVTIGAGIEARASELGQRGEVTRALLFDAIGSAAVEEAADRLGAHVAGVWRGSLADGGNGAPTPAAPLPCRLSPGYGRWPITDQRRLLPLLPHASLGVDLLPSCLMVPKKSISFAMWLGARGRIAEGLAGCSHCTLERCRYRTRGDAASTGEAAPSNTPGPTETP